MALEVDQPSRSAISTRGNPGTDRPVLERDGTLRRVSAAVENWSVALTRTGNVRLT